MRRAWAAMALVLVGACRSKDAKLTADAASAAPLPTSVAASSDVAGAHAREIVGQACLSCHSEEMLRQQRLTEVQWEKVVKKMAGWGAEVATDDLPVVAAHLAAQYAVDAGPHEVATILAVDAVREIAPMDDGPFSGGSAERGGSLYAARCASCHGADARGLVGVNLVDRPLLYRAGDFAQTIRAGRAKMPAQPSTTEGEVADLLAHLRRLRTIR